MQERNHERNLPSMMERIKKSAKFACTWYIFIISFFFSMLFFILFAFTEKKPIYLFEGKYLNKYKNLFRTKVFNIKHGMEKRMVAKWGKNFVWNENVLSARQRKSEMYFAALASWLMNGATWALCGRLLPMFLFILTFSTKFKSLPRL